MTHMRKIFILALTALMLTSCKRYDIDEILLQRNDISLTIKGETVFALDPLEGQAGCNKDRNEFRAYNDDLGEWFTVRCHTSVPDNGGNVKADLKYTGSSATKSIKGVVFTVKNRDSSGKIWLWSKSEKIGVVIWELW